VIVRNIVLGLVGAAIGSSSLIWAGYVTHHGMAQNPLPTPPTTGILPGSGPTTNFTGTNTGVVSTGSNNTINVINNEPRLWGLNQQQAERFKKFVNFLKQSGDCDYSTQRQFVPENEGSTHCTHWVCSWLGSSESRRLYDRHFG